MPPTILHFDNIETLNTHLENNHTLRDSMDNEMSKSFNSFKFTKYSDFLKMTNHEGEASYNILIADNDTFIATAQLQSKEIGQGNDGYPYIVNLAVSPKYRHKGMGGIILKTLTRVARKKGEPEVRLTIHDKSLDKWYKSNNFKRLLKTYNTDTPSPSNPWYYYKKTQTGGTKNSIKKYKKVKSQKNKTKNKTKIKIKNNKSRQKKMLKKSNYSK
mgnify:CR=1 FL=1